MSTQKTGEQTSNQSDSQAAMVYAVFESGGKQHRVSKGDVVQLELLDVNAGDEIFFERVLLVKAGDQIKVGDPLVTKSKVTAEVITHGRGEKINIIKFRRRKHSRKRMGHRQSYTEVRIVDIVH